MQMDTYKSCSMHIVYTSFLSRHFTHGRRRFKIDCEYGRILPAQWRRVYEGEEKHQVPADSDSVCPLWHDCGQRGADHQYFGSVSDASVRGSFHRQGKRFSDDHRVYLRFLLQRNSGRENHKPEEFPSDPHLHGNCGNRCNPASFRNEESDGSVSPECCQRNRSGNSGNSDGFHAHQPVVSGESGFYTSLTLGFSGLSGALFSPLFSYLIRTFGWQRSFRISAGMMMLLYLPVMLLKTAFLTNVENARMKMNLPNLRKPSGRSRSWKERKKNSERSMSY